nr:probable acyl-activating enzyme 5, peroxisomal [Ipomoea batatas]
MDLLTKATPINHPSRLFVFPSAAVGISPAGFIRLKPRTATKCATMDSQSTQLSPKKMQRVVNNVGAPLTPVDFLERAATVYSDCASVVYNDTAYTWSETHERCSRLASSISGLGIKKGDVVSVLSPNIPAMYELHFAVPMTGAILNTINLRLDAKTVSLQLIHSESKLVFVDYQSKDLILEAVSLFPPLSQRPILVLITDDDKNFVGKSTNELSLHDYCYGDMVRGGNPEYTYVGPESEWDPITLNYTSGTTSSPKGVLHSHRGAFCVTITSLLHWSVPPQPVYLWTLPMFHANGWSYSWGMAAVGGTNVCLRRVDPASIYDAIETHGVTHLCGAPVVLNMLANHTNTPLKSPVDILTAGAPPPAAVLERVESLGFRVSHGYGLTETGGPVVTCAWKRKWDNLPSPERAFLKSRQGVRSIGFAGVDVVHPDTGNSVKRDGNTVGEIVLRGNAVMLGYLKDPEGTSECMREDGWFYTGDMGVMHPDGYIEVKDRCKDVIICGGENISSVEVESVLYTHPAVDEAAVVARPDKFWGETPCAFMSLKRGMMEKPTEKDIREFCKEHLPLYKVPRRVVFLAALPKTSTGKIQKFLLRDMAKDLSINQNGNIQREEKNVQKAIKEAAKRNDMGSAKALAKELVRSRKTVNRLYENKAQLNSISMHLGESVAIARTVGHLSKSAEVMKLVNNLMKAPEVARTMQEFSKEMTKAGVIEEMMNDAVDNALDSEDIEEETEEEIDKVLTAIAGETAAELPEAVRKQKLKQPAQEVEDTEGADDEEELEELRARLAKVRS